MTKKEAAAYLNVSERAIERYTSKGKLHVRYKKRDIGGSIAVYDEEELKRLKAAIARATKLKKLPKPADKPTPRKQVALSRVGASDFAQLFGAAFKAHRESEHLTVAITDKLTLDLSEAAALSGLSRGFLIEAINKRQLKARKIGRGWRMKRSDLDAYVKKL